MACTKFECGLLPLVEMGFSHEQAYDALEECEFDYNKAALYLMKINRDRLLGYMAVTKPGTVMANSALRSGKPRALVGASDNDSDRVRCDIA